MLLVDVNQKVNKIFLKLMMVMLSLSQIVFLIHLITFFVDVGPKLASNITHSGKDYFEYLLNPTQKSLFMKPIVADEVVEIIGKLNQSKSPGHDGIGNLIVKKVSSVISKPLSNIFNLSLSTGMVPEQLKLAKVIPIYKKEDPEIFSNYRLCITLLFKNIRETGF